MFLKKEKAIKIFLYSSFETGSLDSIFVRSLMIKQTLAKMMMRAEIASNINIIRVNLSNFCSYSLRYF